MTFKTNFIFKATSVLLHNENQAFRPSVYYINPTTLNIKVL